MTNPAFSEPAPSLLRRLAAFVYDLLLLFGLWILTSALMLVLTGGHLANLVRPQWLDWLFRVALVAVTATFFVWFWTHGGQTLGMRAWRLKLVTENGDPVGMRQALWRLAGGIVAIVPAGLGLWLAAADPHHRAWHDRISGTRMIVLKKIR